MWWNREGGGTQVGRVVGGARRANRNQNHELESYQVHYYITYYLRVKPGSKECMERVRSLVM